MLQETRLGWVVAGKLSSPSTIATKLCHLSRSTLEDAVRKFWETEELPTRRIFSPEEEECEKHYQQTVIRLPSGHYAVKLPFNDNKNRLGESHGLALKRLQGLERRLSANAKLYEESRSFLKEYEELGHMSRIENASIQESYFLPHHAVLKDSSNTTRLRVVFDVSARTTTGHSLNDTLLTGPVLQRDLFSVVTRFRLHNIVFTADIEKMFRQVYMQEDDRRFQRILWRDNPQEAVRTYQLNTVTYIISSNVYSTTGRGGRATTLSRSGRSSKTRYVHGRSSNRSKYVRASARVEDSASLLKWGGFHLRKWASNHSRFNEGTDNKAEEHVSLDFADTHKTLGVLWNQQQDCLLYRVNIRPHGDKVTKRTILAQIASLYDPLGLLGPVIVKAKILLQILWKLKVGWDEQIPTEICDQWKTYLNSLEELNNITFPRQVCTTQVASLQLHGFADASEAAYGACLYIRSTRFDQTYHTALVCSRSRIAPLKKLTLPRLELCAALVLAQLCQAVLKAFGISFDRVILW
ncbi:PREDICTED: uncharacterized protein LOC105556797 [Vollenhovia emeryi]|uniref:uncharacterized protein LOC105556797 n=1 Tax=Vollenhovia emeryi TaxID=411798 RepID=UPI0005F40E02|nr:PREDICTED: uncharacterized protein LOC105556797 [Vollenhovia emeryi]